VELLNTLYVTTPHAYLRLDHDTLRVDLNQETLLRVPLIHLECVMCFGDVMITPAVIHRCGEDGRSLVLLDRRGRFKARLEGPVNGNVLLRRAQHETLSSQTKTLRVARSFVGGKLQNSRHSLLRAARESDDPSSRTALSAAAATLADTIVRAGAATTLESLRGCEGEGALVYFSVFTHMVRANRDIFELMNRSRRPPRNPMNATISFAYALLLTDCVSALESVGLDPQVGYLHALRPGRPALALDLIEEMRPVVADRLVLTMVNRRQLTANDFDYNPGGSVLLTERGRRTVIEGYQKRKQETVRHRVLDRLVPIGTLPHIQARLLARQLRDDIESYPPFLAH
jgi:CRISPR-associated protein Cas1